MSRQPRTKTQPLVVEWRCSPYYQNTGLYPVTDYFQHAAGVRPRRSPRRPAGQAGTVTSRRGTLGRLSELVPLFAALLSLPSDERYPPLNLSPAGQKQRTLDALVNWFGDLADRQPVLFIVEDLHWSDPSTLELLELMVDQAASQRILALFTFRPEFTVPWAARAHQSQLAAEPAPQATGGGDDAAADGQPASAAGHRRADRRPDRRRAAVRGRIHQDAAGNRRPEDGRRRPGRTDRFVLPGRDSGHASGPAGGPAGSHDQPAGRGPTGCDAGTGLQLRTDPGRRRVGGTAAAGGVGQVGGRRNPVPTRPAAASAPTSSSTPCCRKRPTSRC